MVATQQEVDAVTAVASNNDVFQAELETIADANNGQITPLAVLDAARSPASPLHEYFTWDDTIAGEKYRLVQAGILIRRWTGVLIRAANDKSRVVEMKTRRVQSTDTSRRDGTGYERVENIMADPDKREAMLRTALRELDALQKRFSQLTELASVWKAIGKIRDKFAE